MNKLHLLAAAALSFVQLGSVSTVSAQDIFVVGGYGDRILIPNGSTSNTEQNGTNAGFVAVDGGDKLISFTIKNLDQDTPLAYTGPVTITGANASDFNVSFLSPGPVESNSGASLVIHFNPTAAGVRTATVNIPTNDPDAGESVYTFTLRGTGVIGLPIAPSDLSLSLLSLKAKAVPGGSVKVSGSVGYANTSPSSTDAPTIRIYISEDEFIDEDDALVQEIVGKPLAGKDPLDQVKYQKAKIKATYGPATHGYVIIYVIHAPTAAEDDSPGNNTAVAFFGVTPKV